MLILPDNPKKRYEYVILSEDKVAEDKAWDNASGYLVGNRLYKVDKKNGKIYPFMQKFKEKFFYASRLDTIVNVKKEDNQEGRIWEIIYKNGDTYKYVNNFKNGKYQIGTLHRPGGVVQIKKNSPIQFIGDDGCITEYSSNKFSSCPILNNNNTIEFTSFDEVVRQFYGREDLPKLIDGKKTFADGTVVEYVRGLTGDERKAIAAKEEDRKAAEQKIWEEKQAKLKAEKEKEQAKEKAEYEKERSSFIKKYGFYPGDCETLEEQFKPGRSVPALMEYYKGCIHLMEDHGTTKKYKFNNPSYNRYNVIFWTRNGKIISMKFINPN